MRRRSKVNKQLSEINTENKRKKLQSEAKDIEKKLQKSYSDERSAAEHRAVAAIKKNSKYFYSYVKKYSKVSTGVGPLVDDSGKLISNPKEMAEILASQYNSVFSTPKYDLNDDNETFRDTDLVNKPDKLHKIDFNQDDIEKAIGEISPTAAAGPDGFPAILLKKCSHILSKPISILWKKSMETGDIPQVLKTAHIVPIHKGGSKGIPKNYRPIALTSHIINVFGKVVRKRIVEYIETHNLFNRTQHGFRQGRSCLSQLLAHYDNILELLESGENVDIVYIDFAKAFDKVDFGIVFQRLAQLGIQGHVGR